MTVRHFAPLSLLVMVVIGLIAGGALVASAQSPEGAAGAEETLAFYLPKWKEMHFDDSEKATKHFGTIKKLGCEVRQANHDGHIDVIYRCNEWKVLDVQDLTMADQWAAWLKNAGFEVSLASTNAVFAEGPEVVEFRMMKWKVIHGNGSAEEAKILEQLKMTGVEVVVQPHGNHDDIRLCAPTWRAIRVADHATAEQWMQWFRANSFEVRHEH